MRDDNRLGDVLADREVILVSALAPVYSIRLHRQSWPVSSSNSTLLHRLIQVDVAIKTSYYLHLNVTLSFLQQHLHCYLRPLLPWLKLLLRFFSYFICVYTNIYFTALSEYYYDRLHFQLYNDIIEVQVRVKIQPYAMRFFL